jgi:hypothetical protein
VSTDGMSEEQVLAKLTQIVRSRIEQVAR